MSGADGANKDKCGDHDHNTDNDAGDNLVRGSVSDGVVNKERSQLAMLAELGPLPVLSSRDCNLGMRS